MKESRKCRKCGESLTEDETLVISGKSVYHTNCFIAMGEKTEMEQTKREIQRVKA